MGGATGTGREHNDGVSLREHRAQLRGAVARGDGPAVAQLLTVDAWPQDALQLVGDGVLAAVACGVGGAEVLARRCIAALEERDWEGDAELAALLASRVGAGPTPMLRPVPVDLEELAMVLEGDPVHGGGRIDLHSGEVWPQSVLDDESAADDEEDGSRWLWVDSRGSRDGYRDMELFIGTVDDPGLADRLAVAITGRGAFRRFKDVLAGDPAAADRWYAFSEDRLRGRARSWLAAQGYIPSPPACAIHVDAIGLAWR